MPHTPEQARERYFRRIDETNRPLALRVTVTPEGFTIYKAQLPLGVESQPIDYKAIQHDQWERENNSEETVRTVKSILDLQTLLYTDARAGLCYSIEVPQTPIMPRKCHSLKWDNSDQQWRMESLGSATVQNCPTLPLPNRYTSIKQETPTNLPKDRDASSCFWSEAYACWIKLKWDGTKVSIDKRSKHLFTDNQPIKVWNTTGQGFYVGLFLDQETLYCLSPAIYALHQPSIIFERSETTEDSKAHVKTVLVERLLLELSRLEPTASVSKAQNTTWEKEGKKFQPSFKPFTDLVSDQSDAYVKIAGFWKNDLGDIKNSTRSSQAYASILWMFITSLGLAVPSRDVSLQEAEAVDNDVKPFILDENQVTEAIQHANALLAKFEKERTHPSEKYPDELMAFLRLKVAFSKIDKPDLLAACLALVSDELSRYSGKKPNREHLQTVAATMAKNNQASLGEISERIRRGELEEQELTHSSALSIADWIAKDLMNPQGKDTNPQVFDAYYFIKFNANHPVAYWAFHYIPILLSDYTGSVDQTLSLQAHIDRRYAHLVNDIVSGMPGIDDATKKLMVSYLTENNTEHLNEIKESIMLPNTGGYTPLHCACNQGHTNIVTAITKLFDTDKETLKSLLLARDKDGNTALHHAACHGHTEIVKTLIAGLDSAEKMALLKIQGEDGSTALHRAVFSGHTEIVKALLAGLNSAEKMTLITIQDVQGSNPPHMACIWNQTTIADTILKLFESDKKTLGTLLLAKNKDEWDTLLHLACLMGKRTIINTILKLFESDKKTLKELFLVKNKGERTPLHEACANDRNDPTDIITAVLKLFEHDQETLKAILLAKDKDGYTPLHWACIRSQPAIVNVLLELFKADKETLKTLLLAKDKKGRTPLHEACLNGRTTIVSILENFIKDTQSEQTTPPTDCPAGPITYRVPMAIQPAWDGNDLRTSVQVTFNR